MIVNGCRRGRLFCWDDRLSLVWVRSDAATLRHRLIARASERDAVKLADFGAFTERMRLDDSPAIPHTVVDNRLTASASLGDQIDALVAAVRPQKSDPVPLPEPDLS